MSRFVDLRMTQPSVISANSSGLKALLVLLALGLGIYIVGPSLYWELRESVSEAKHSGSCSPCQCDCTALESVNLFSDCAKLDPVLQDIDHIKIQDLHEELKLQEYSNEERQLHFDNAYLEIKKLTSQYQKEAEKCNVGMETSEEAREKPEAELALEVQKTKVWEYRARQLGWQEVSAKTTSDFEFEKVRNLKLQSEGEADTSVKLDSTRSDKFEE
ncbi:hypothetical protein O6H91_07G022500 [Diphasiastrum complanatum]|uniref:Uncharacterized protein n=1 Tax=Diphasiastrum complanatum TaxID=34168 RepID=A0ACC2D366_DIPCM|nr:hypothetical protein O6H91_07G022500 [Diphasiastrum complanatum]